MSKMGDNEKLILAVEVAMRQHNGQTRKYNDDPFIFHPIRVARKIAEHGYNTNVVVAAILHDTVEDCTISIASIKRLFGNEVGNLVYEVTNQFEKKDAPHLNRKKRKQLEFARLAKASDEAKAIKLADRIDNLGEMPVNHQEARGFFPKFLSESEALLDAVKGNNVLSKELADVIKQLQTIIKR